MTPGPGTVFKMQSCSLGEACPTLQRMREYMEAPVAQTGHHGQQERASR